MIVIVILVINVGKKLTSYKLAEQDVNFYCINLEYSIVSI